VDNIYDWYFCFYNLLVGFGDFYPKTNLGRVVGLIAAMIGTAVTSVLIVSLQSRLTLVGVEHHVE
jgi:hypothetical protein